NRAIKTKYKGTDRMVGSFKKTKVRIFALNAPYGPKPIDDRVPFRKALAGTRTRGTAVGTLEPCQFHFGFLGGNATTVLGQAVGPFGGQKEMCTVKIKVELLNGPTLVFHFDLQIA